jgi:uncharacterized membrane protein
MSVYNRRNALVGFIALRAASRALERRRARRSGGRRKVVLVTVLGIVSLGALAALAAFVRRRKREPQRLEGYAVSDEAEEAGEPAAAGQGATTAEPIPAT